MREETYATSSLPVSTRLSKQSLPSQTATPRQKARLELEWEGKRRPARGEMRKAEESQLVWRNQRRDARTSARERERKKTKKRQPERTSLPNLLTWKNSTFCLGTLNETSSTVLVVNLNAFSTSTFLTSTVRFGRKANPWIRLPAN